MKVSSNGLYQNVLLDIDKFLIDSPEKSAKQFAALALKESLLKKYLESGTTSESADSAALKLFLDTNDSLLSEPKEPLCMLDQMLMGEVKASLDRFWWRTGDSSLVSGLSEIFDKSRVGPGSSLGSPSTDFYTKLFGCKLTATSRALYEQYSIMTKRTDLHSHAEKHRQESFGDVDIVRHSKLLFVPKRNDISRTICVEPSLNMFFQLGLADILERRLRSVYCIDLSTQPDMNRELARRGSIDSSFSTIDLSSASDSLSIGVLKAILPREMFSWLMSLRTPNTLLPDGRVVPLNMISTMGNGFTFPLQTIIFTAVVDAAYKLSSIPLVRNSRDGTPGNFAVFGDDIIVDTRCVRKVLRLLDMLGFKTNASKTFIEGPFRESCGSDWFLGHFVRGVYIKSLRTLQDRYIAINLLNDWSATTGISLRNAVQYLLRSIKWIEISPSLGLDQGLHLPLSMCHPRRNKNGSFKLRYYSPLVRRVRIEDGRFSGEWKDRKVNVDGLILSFINGAVRSEAITLRQSVIRYQMKTCVLPYWDRIQLSRSYRRFSFTRWETAVYLNCFKTI